MLKLPKSLLTVFVAAGLIGSALALPGRADESLTTTPDGTCSITAGNQNIGGGAHFMGFGFHFNSGGSEDLVDMDLPPEYVGCLIRQAETTDSVDVLLISAWNHENPLVSKMVGQWLFMQVQDNLGHEERMRWLARFQDEDIHIGPFLTVLYGLYNGSMTSPFDNSQPEAQPIQPVSQPSGVNPTLQL